MDVRVDGTKTPRPHDGRPGRPRALCASYASSLLALWPPGLCSRSPALLTRLSRGPDASESGRHSSDSLVRVWRPRPLPPESPRCPGIRLCDSFTFPSCLPEHSFPVSFPGSSERSFEGENVGGGDGEKCLAVNGPTSCLGSACSLPLTASAVPWGRVGGGLLCDLRPHLSSDPAPASTHKCRLQHKRHFLHEALADSPAGNHPAASAPQPHLCGSSGTFVTVQLAPLCLPSALTCFPAWLSVPRRPPGVRSKFCFSLVLSQ
ncbi:uncharacterized protein LOC122206935 [Panthera leo]|uniref:uncharacterized protein LOC122206935 n=1 Tax=Panthera leo TaxID=9689 RepID=UPI001C69E262|nr:uncharacterized protein LOC122206935 [Panthera leo]